MLLDLIIQIHDMQDIQKLAFIFMQTFYLHIEDRTGIHVDSVVLFNIFCKADFVLVFDFHELASCVFIIHIWFQFCDLRQICDPSASDLVCEPVGKQRVSMCKETSLCNTVCLVVELLRHHFVEIFQLLMFQDFCVEFRNTVYREACNDRHVCHVHLSVHENSHLLDFLLIARVHLAHLDKESAVNLLYDLVDTRKKAGEQVDGPFLKCLCHDRMVRICAGLCRHIPCFFPAQSFLVDEKTHQFRNGNSRVSIVHLDDNFLIKFSDIAVFLLVFRDQRLQAGGNEEILLFQTKFFS